jgi:hypothetical protein
LPCRTSPSALARCSSRCGKAESYDRCIINVSTGIAAGWTVCKIYVEGNIFGWKNTFGYIFAVLCGFRALTLLHPILILDCLPYQKLQTLGYIYL